jgi:hypothetical protein
MFHPLERVVSGEADFLCGDRGIVEILEVVHPGAVRLQIDRRGNTGSLANWAEDGFNGVTPAFSLQKMGGHAFEVSADFTVPKHPGMREQVSNGAFKCLSRPGAMISISPACKFKKVLGIEKMSIRQKVNVRGEINVVSPSRERKGIFVTVETVRVESGIV